ncbi:MAG: hypothetical protein MJ001_07325, partial [Paludibacteraceae bacterium]|nr:hypothetical protein [Paludibacteraceae bacterium]
SFLVSNRTPSPQGLSVAPEYAIKEALVFVNGNIETKGKVTYLPIYTLMYLKPSGQEQQLFRFKAM